MPERNFRILIPDPPDSRLVYSSAFAFVEPLFESGVQLLRDQPWFLHAKSFVVDDAFAGVGTANFDNRSFRLNFEVTALVADPTFVTAVEAMFVEDFRHAKPMQPGDFSRRGLPFRLLVGAAYLLAPLQ